MQLPAELDFLENIICTDYEKQFHNADWLKSPFESNVWVYNFDFKKDKELNWNVTLYDSSSLTDKENHQLLISLKYWLIASTDRYVGSHVPGNKLSASTSTKSRDFRTVLKIIDHLLLNGNHYKLKEFSLGAITQDDLIALLDKVYSNKETNESLYDWSSRTSKYLLKLLYKTDSNAIARFLQKYPSVSFVDPSTLSECPLGFSEDKIVSIRAAIYLNQLGYLKKGSSKKDSFGGVWGMNTSKVAKDIYKNTLYIKTVAKPAFPSLEVNFENEVFINRECSGVKVTTKENEFLAWSNLQEYRRALEKIQVLNILNLPAPSQDEINKLETYSPEVRFKDGRFKTVPYKIIFIAIREAIEFHLKYGLQLVDTLCDLVKYAIKNKIHLTSITEKELLNILPKELQELGVSRLGITCLISGEGLTPNRKANTETYYHSLRSNRGLLDLIHVYYGAVKIVVGVLTARRDGELLDLDAGDCLDITEQWLVFKKRKSTKMLFGARNTEARPVDPIAVDMMKNLIRLQDKHIELGVLKKHIPLFAPPQINASGKFKTNRRLSDSYVDLFCDYIQLDKNTNKERYYLRQHQLRRFFALLFFHSSQIGGLETLQWMLGHTDPEHVWHYISESIPGSVLRGAKAQYVAESLVKNNNNYRNLSEFVYKRFNTNEFSIIDIDELEEYIESLIKEGKAIIEPEFFIDGNDKKMRIITKVIGAD
ncbi:site-specific integrase [Photobacterium leiognathi]|uniref:site-specific integrase n=1 Tax=Photobacterium leiognathi TaxID=553611 RepID=UPI00076AAA28|nr:site-specific integrase [Photobacterium leiognathi]